MSRKPRPAHWPTIIDSLTGANVMVSYAHYEIHSGCSFVLGATSTPASGAALVLAFKVGIEPAHMFARWASEAQATFEVLEGVLWTTNTGSLVPIYCRNRQNQGTPGLEEDKTATPAFTATGNALKDPSGLSGGIVLNTQTTWANKLTEGGGERGIHEFILNPGEAYAYRVTNNDTSSRGVELELDFYEAS